MLGRESIFLFTVASFSRLALSTLLPSPTHPPVRRAHSTFYSGIGLSALGP